MTLVTLLLATLACKRPPEALGNPDVGVGAPDGAAPTSMTAEERASLVDNFARVHFATDSSSLDPAGIAALRANADILVKHPDVRIEVEGHADERGTVDYNLALGQRRSQEVVRWLATYGVPRSRLETLSLGEERPIATGSTDVAWAENRRAEFRVLDGSAVRGTAE